MSKRTFWLESPILHDYSTTCLWTLGVHWAGYVKEKYSLRDKHCLSIGCGTGQLERGLLKNQCVKSIEAFDNNPTFLEEARSKAKSENLDINYFIEDANSIHLGKENYGAVFAHNSLHHIENLEHLMHEVSDSLLPDGFFIIVEYAGPSRFLLSDIQIRFINAFLDIIPEKYKVIIGKNVLKKDVSRETMKIYIDADPTEAVRSSEIIPLLYSNFEILEDKNMGGTILHTLMTDIIGNFDETNKEDRRVLNSLCFLEKNLIETKCIPSDEKFLVCKKISKNMNALR